MLLWLQKCYLQTNSEWFSFSVQLSVFPGVNNCHGVFAGPDSPLGCNSLFCVTKRFHPVGASQRSPGTSVLGTSGLQAWQRNFPWGLFCSIIQEPINLSLLSLSSPDQVLLLISQIFLSLVSHVFSQLSIITTNTWGQLHRLEVLLLLTIWRVTIRDWAASSVSGPMRATETSRERLTWRARKQRGS